EIAQLEKYANDTSLSPMARLAARARIAELSGTGPGVLTSEAAAAQIARLEQFANDASTSPQARMAAQVRIAELKGSQRGLELAASAARASSEVLNQASCFVAGTPLLTPTGKKVIEQFLPGDTILSRAESDPYGPVAAKLVEEV